MRDCAREVLRHLVLEVGLPVTGDRHGDPRHLPAGPGGGQEPQAAGQESSVEAAEDGLGDTRGDFSCRVYVF